MPSPTLGDGHEAAGIYRTLAGATTGARGAHGQQAASIRRARRSVTIRSCRHLWNKALLRGLRDVGWVEGKNIAIEYRYADGRKERLPELVTDLIQKKVDILVSPPVTQGYP